MKSNKGNVLFIILIAIGLFASISVAVKQSTTASGSIDKEQADLLATELSQWLGLTTRNFNRMKLINKIPDDGFDLATFGHGWVDKCSDGSKCALFENDRGGRTPNFDITDRGFWKSGSGGCNGVPTYGLGPGSHALGRLIRIEGVGDDDLADIVITINCVSDDVCTAYNEKVGISSTPIPLDGFNAEDHNFVGGPDFPEPTVAANRNIGDEATELAGQRSFCLRNGLFSNDQTEIVHVLLAR